MVKIERKDELRCAACGGKIYGTEGVHHFKRKDGEIEHIDYGQPVISEVRKKKPS